LTIDGNGFSLDKTKVSVKAGSLNCDVKTSSLHQITCQLEDGTTATGTTFKAGGGVKYRKWS